jgi:hypothetical protein
MELAMVLGVPLVTVSATMLGKRSEAALAIESAALLATASETASAGRVGEDVGDQVGDGVGYGVVGVSVVGIGFVWGRGIGWSLAWRRARLGPSDWVVVAVSMGGVELTR